MFNRVLDMNSGLVLNDFPKMHWQRSIIRKIKNRRIRLRFFIETKLVLNMIIYHYGFVLFNNDVTTAR